MIRSLVANQRIPFSCFSISFGVKPSFEGSQAQSLIPINSVCILTSFAITLLLDGAICKVLPDVRKFPPISVQGPNPCSKDSTSVLARNMIEIILNDRVGKKIKVKCKYSGEFILIHGHDFVLRSLDDTIGDLKKLVALQIGTKPEKIVIKRQQYL